jgi:hypothetical protein
MSQKVKVFQRILKERNPTLYNKVSINVNTKSNYSQFLGLDGRMRAELNYIPQKCEIVISFPNIDDLYYDISDYVRFVWNNVDVMATFDYDGTNHFQFIV